MNVEQIISEVLTKCNQHGKTVVVGGYIRNTLLGYGFNDIDILTTCSPQKLKELFPQLSWTDQGLSLGVTRMMYRGIQFEFSSCIEEEFTMKLTRRDFTVNAFYYDGKKTVSQLTGDEDIKQRLLRPMPGFQDHMEFSPHTYIRALRFTSLYNLEWTDELFEELKKSPHFFEAIPNGRIQSEAYEIIKGEYIIKSFYYYQKLGLIKPNPKLFQMKGQTVPTYNQNISARLTYLSYLIGQETVLNWLSLHSLSQKLIDEIQEYLPYLENENIKVPPKKLPFVTLLKRYQFNDDKEELRNFLIKQRS
ncbi:CCA tRNA nucleotidyltransferase [Bacillus cereus]|uniref:CCA tRNA nucleotidyltransferase n=1 Tax=Bacillus cereus TaxID=1396 RepID=UPI000B4B15AD|nr:CCA tRNA nucleotidyltransferase [Bacillus cereus]